VEVQTDGHMRLGPGTLYNSIQVMLENGLIDEMEQRDSGENTSERRRYYRITPTGRKLARVEADRLASVLRVARQKKILRGDYV
jgi:DNA-binding PadR family transcriptional regulator